MRPTGTWQGVKLLLATTVDSPALIDSPSDGSWTPNTDFIDSEKRVININVHLYHGLFEFWETPEETFTLSLFNSQVSA